MELAKAAPRPPSADERSSPVRLIVAGRWDPLVPMANAKYLETRLPNSRLDVIDSGHCVWEEAADQYGAIIATWVPSGYLAGSGLHHGSPTY
jgi:hypothetical protein